MTNPKTVATLFEEEPMRWGLRGDPHLWNEMREHFEEKPLPESVDELIKLIETLFEALTGHPISERDSFVVERISDGGMSRGMISPEFWRDKVLPMLRVRYFDIQKTINE